MNAFTAFSLKYLHMHLQQKQQIKPSFQNNRYQLPNVGVYAGQKQKRELPNVIRDLLANEFGETRLEIAKDLVKYIVSWTKRSRVGALKLSKEDVMVKLGQLLLTPFQITPTIRNVQGCAIVLICTQF